MRPVPGGNGHGDVLLFTQPPQRVVSLVPSMTESLFDLGVGEAVVGVTDFCRPPEPRPTVGGTRAPEIERILALAPDLVIANQEENSRRTVEQMRSAGLRLWLTFPKCTADAIQVLWTVVELFRASHAIPRLKTLETTLEWTRRAAEAQAAVPVFVPIWAEDHAQAGLWWMSFNRQTYAHDVLACCGGENVCAGRDRLYPLAADLGLAGAEPPAERDVRYPRLLPAEVVGLRPEVILVPDEPYAFTGSDVEQLMTRLAATPAVEQGRVFRVPGALLTWHGTRLAQALAELPSLLRLAG
jgi:ABC-type hemin transport system substrate-binding protein